MAQRASVHRESQMECAVEIVNIPNQDHRKDAKKALKTLSEKKSNKINKTKIGGAVDDPLEEKKPKKRGR